MNTAANAQIVQCPKCGAKNRISPGSAGDPVCGRCKTPLTADMDPVVITDQNFAEEVERSPLPMLIDFWAAWCGPCRMIAPIIEQLAMELSGKIGVGKLDVDANKITAARFRVQSIPSLLVFKNGQKSTGSSACSHEKRLFGG